MAKKGKKYSDSERALTELRAKGMKRLVLDLRGNPAA